MSQKNQNSLQTGQPTSSFIIAEESHFLRVSNIRDGKAIASCIIADWHEPHPTVAGLFVEPEYRRQGIASTMLSLSIQFAIDRKKNGLFLTFPRENTIAESVFRKRGFFSFNDDPTTFWMGHTLDPSRSHPATRQPSPTAAPGDPEPSYAVSA